MVQSPSWEANWFAASRNSPHFTEPEGSLPHSQTSATCLYPGPAQSSPYTHIHLLEIHPNIIHPSTPRSPQWSLSLRFPHQDPIHPALLTHTRHMPSPSHYSYYLIHAKFRRRKWLGEGASLLRYFACAVLFVWLSVLNLCLHIGYAGKFFLFLHLWIGKRPCSNLR